MKRLFLSPLLRTTYALMTSDATAEGKLVTARVVRSMKTQHFGNGNAKHAPNSVSHVCQIRTSKTTALTSAHPVFITVCIHRPDTESSQQSSYPNLIDHTKIIPSREAHFRKQRDDRDEAHNVHDGRASLRGLLPRNPGHISRQL